MTFADCYAFLDEWVVQALRSARHRGDLPAAQRHREPDGQDRRRRAEAARQRRRAAPRDHGYDMDGERMTEVLRIGREKLSDKGTKSAAKRVDPLRSQTGLPRAEIIERMIETFRDAARTAPTARSRAEEYARGRAARRREVRHRRVAVPGPVTDARARRRARGAIAVGVVLAALLVGGILLSALVGQLPVTPARGRRLAAARRRHPERAGRPTTRSSSRRCGWCASRGS